MSKMKLKFRKGSYELGAIRDYGVYGKYEKTEEGWKRLRKGYPSFRRTYLFNKIKEFLLLKGENKTMIESNNAKGLKEYMKDNDLLEEFKGWEKNNGQI